MSRRREPSEGTMGSTRATKKVGVRLDDAILARVDAIVVLRSAKEGRDVPRTEAVRDLVEVGLPLREAELARKDAESAPAAPPSATKGSPHGRGAGGTKKRGRAGARR
jgi:hypothetical protein